ncbi:MAG: ABA4-like family protein [Gemmatimonadota bacterium]
MYESLFGFAALALVGWALMIFLPGWSVTRRIASWAVFPVYLAVLYVLGVVPLVVAAGPGIVRDFGSPEGVVGLLANADVALVVWIHILVLDHLVGVLIYRDNMRERVAPAPVQSVILFLVLMFGPAGFLLYYALRVVRGRGPAIGGADAAAAG